MCDGIGVLHFLMSLRIKRLLFYNFVFLLVVLISLDCFDSADGKKRKHRKRRKNRDTPRMIVFNLDETMWPFQVDKVMTPPFNVTSVPNQIVDNVGKIFDLFPDVVKVLDDLEKKYYLLGVISQSNDVAKVENLLQLFDIDQYLNIHEVFPGSKATHLKKISERTKVPFEDILYFDSDPTDMKEIGDMEVTTVLIDKNGITVKTVSNALHNYNVTQVAKENQAAKAANISSTHKPKT